MFTVAAGTMQLPPAPTPRCGKGSSWARATREGSVAGHIDWCKAGEIERLHPPRLGRANAGSAIGTAKASWRCVPDRGRLLEAAQVHRPLHDAGTGDE